VALALSGSPPPAINRTRLAGAFCWQAGAKRRKGVLLGPRSDKRIGRLRASVSAPFAQQPGTPEPPGTPPQPPSDPTAPPPYEDPPRPIPIPRPDQLPDVIDDPPPRRNAQEFTGPASSRSPPHRRRMADHVEKRMMCRLDFGRQPEPDV